jgi:hypothetical protein
VTHPPNGTPDAKDEIDALLRETLRDDLPAEVEARLERRVERFMASRADFRRRSGPGLLTSVLWAPSRRLVAAAASLLLACGFGLQARTGADGMAESLSGVSAAVSLSRTIRAASSMTCTGLDAELASPAALADRIYRRWVLVRSRAHPDGTVVDEFRARDEPALYQLVSTDASQPPSEIRKIPLADAARNEGTRWGYVATCTWEVPPAGTPGIVFMLGR